MDSTTKRVRTVAMPATRESQRKRERNALASIRQRRIDVRDVYMIYCVKVSKYETNVFKIRSYTTIYVSELRVRSRSPI